MVVLVSWLPIAVYIALSVPLDIATAAPYGDSVYHQECELIWERIQTVWVML